MTREELGPWHAAVVDALAGLPTAQGSAVRMSYFHRLNRTEIAKRLGISPIQAGHLIADGLRALAVTLLADRPPVAMTA